MPTRTTDETDILRNPRDPRSDAHSVTDPRRPTQNDQMHANHRIPDTGGECIESMLTGINHHESDTGSGLRAASLFPQVNATGSIVHSGLWRRTGQFARLDVMQREKQPRKRTKRAGRVEADIMGNRPNWRGLRISVQSTGKRYDPTPKRQSTTNGDVSGSITT